VAADRRYLSDPEEHDGGHVGARRPPVASCYTGIYPTDFIPLDNIQRVTAEKS